MATQTIYVSKDTYVADGSSSGNNYGTENEMKVVSPESSSSTRRRAMMEFDISGIPSGSTITNAVLHIYINKCQSGSATYYFKRMLGQFVETTVCWNDQPSHTSENSTNTSMGSTGWKTIVVTAMVQDAFAGENYVGIKVLGSSSSHYIDISTRETSNDPYIVITYDEQETIIYGDIQDRFGSGVSNCHVTAEDDVTHIEYYDTDADGEYSVVVGNESHNYTVSVWHSGYVVRSRTIAVTPNDFNQCDFIPPSYNLVASVEGTVEDNYGNPVENAFVWGEGTNWYGCKTNANGEYALPLHTGGTYDIKACKTNFNERSYGSITQSGYHPTTDEQTTKNFTGTYCLERILGTDDLGFAVYGRSVVIPDDLPTTSSLIAADDPATTTVKLKTWKFGSGAALTTTSSGTSDSSEGEGSGGTNYKGDCGDCGE